MAAANSIAPPARVKDITGKTFGKLTAVSYAGSHLGSQAGAYWTCICECGTEKIVAAGALRSGSIQTCGCSKDRTDETGKVYGRLTVLAFAGKAKSGDSTWECQCECGNKTIVARGDLRKRYGGTTSCGCGRESAGGKCKTTEYASWKGMKRRCYSTSDPEYHNYGGRNIGMCDRWKNSFLNFLADMGEKPFPEATIDRIDVNGNYEPSNCRWATKLEQGQNTRKARMLTHNGETLCLREWARRLGITHGTLSRRIAKGWPPEKVFSSEHYFSPPPRKVSKSP